MEVSKKDYGVFAEFCDNKNYDGVKRSEIKSINLSLQRKQLVCAARV